MTKVLALIPRLTRHLADLAAVVTESPELRLAAAGLHQELTGHPRIKTSPMQRICYVKITLRDTF